MADKLARSRVLLDAVLKRLDPAVVAVAYTGGKDSGVALALWCEALARSGKAGPRAISVDTGLKFPEVSGFRDRLCAEWGVELRIARPRVDLATYPVAQDKLSCCRDLKIEPLHRVIRETGVTALVTGLRRDEHASRAERPYAELKPATEHGPEHWQVNVILDWTEMDVWAHLTGECLPYCELYHQGYRSLGCMPCTRMAAEGEDERAGRDQDKERQLEALKALGYF
ncbi:phosphoadenosine phosphosulfate reductase family protein [Humidesulfovibrio sp.]|uniref:phosphoadenosine phosphosulfate reductase family protein n=1 Tax=Humidesulfovibrio sp. TaxID=2910988 RepID=UPI0039C89DF7